MKKVDASVEDLVGMIERGELLLPEMQRRYVWQAPRVRDLFDSLYRGYPTGSILVWETDKPMPTRSLSIAQGTSPFAGHKLLLDGQQRLTCLSAVIRGEPIGVRGKKRPIEILFNLDLPDGPPSESLEVTTDEGSPLADDDELESEEDTESGAPGIQERLNLRTFVVASKALQGLPQWVSVSRVFQSTDDAEILKRAGITSFDDPRYSRFSSRLQRLRKIRDYMYVIYVLERDLDYEEVAEIFVRVNSLGMKLRGSDLALAQITARWPNSLKLLEEFQAECEEAWFTIDLGLLVRAMVVFASGQSRFRTVANIPIEKLKDAWESAKSGLRFAVNFLRANAGIEDESLLSSPLLFIPIARLSQLRSERLSRDEEKELLYWLHLANVRGRYSRGSSETLLDEDLSILLKGGGPRDLLRPVEASFGRLHIEPSDLTGRGVRSPLFSLAFLALRAAGAKDWQSGLGISLTHQGRLHFIQYHHIFPKSLLSKNGYEKGEINEIANMAFVSGRTNRQLGYKEPAAYLPEIIESRGEDAITSQLLPLDPSLHRIENYRQFLEVRRKALADRINQFMKSALE